MDYNFDDDVYFDDDPYDELEHDDYYDDLNEGDSEEYEPYPMPTRTERLKWRLGSIGWKLRHPVRTLRDMWRDRVVWRLRKCQADGCNRRGVVDGICCADHFIPF